MAKFTITIPNIGEVEIDGPFATEDSIRKLTAAINKSGTTGKNKKTDDFSKVFDDLEDSTDHASGALRRLIDEAEEDAKSFKNLNVGLNKAMNGLKSMVSGANSVSGSFGSMIDSFGSGTSSLLGMFGPLGTAGGMLVTAFTGLIGAAIGFITGLEETNDKIMNAGALFKNGIDDLQANARDGGLAMSSLTKSILENADSYRMLTGGLVGGTSTITKAFKGLGKTQQNVLYNMGYTSDEILSGMADYAAAAKLSGRDLDMSQIAEGGADYLKVQRELTRLTGKTVEEQKRMKDAMRGQAEFQAFFNSLADPRLRTAVENGMLAVPDATKDMVSKLLRGTPLTDPAMVQLLNMIPGAGKEFAELGRLAREGAISEEEYSQRFNAAVNNLNKTSKSIQNSDKMYGMQADLYRDSNPVLARLIEMLQAGSEKADAFNESLKSSSAAMDLVNGPQGVMAQALGVFRMFDEKVSKIMQTFGATIAKIFAPNQNGIFTRILYDLVDFSDTVVTAFDRWVDGTDSFDTVWKNVKASFLANFGDIFNTTTGIMKTWYDTISNVISTGIQRGFDKVLDSMGYETDTKEQADALEAINKLPENLKQYITDPSYTSNENYANLTPAEKEQIRKVLDLLWEVDDLAAINYQQVGGSKLLRTEAYAPIPAPVDTEELNAKREGAIRRRAVDPYAVPLDQTNNNALGGMFEPKQGGHIIRVAEAMSPELVAPAKRGTDGKLGLEVTGVMLDNSRLLQSLVKINEGQAMLMAGLNDTMSNVSNSVDRLVSEQRQANRLAV